MRPIALARRRGDITAEADAQAKLGHVLASADDPDKAKAAYNQVFALSKRRASPAAEASADSGVAELLFLEGRYRQAALRYERAAMYEDRVDPIPRVEAIAGAFESYCAAQDADRVQVAGQELVTASQESRQEEFATGSLSRGARWWLETDIEMAASLSSILTAAAGIDLTGNADVAIDGLAVMSFALVGVASVLAAHAMLRGTEQHRMITR